MASENFEKLKEHYYQRCSDRGDDYLIPRRRQLQQHLRVYYNEDFAAEHDAIEKILNERKK